MRLKTTICFNTELTSLQTQRLRET